jgi:membrane protease YdiL (CAAX protease family)
MKSIKDFIKHNPVLTYFIITFAISWGAVLVMIGYKGMPTTKEQLDAQLPVAILAMLGGPSVAGLLCTGLVHGRAGFRELLSRLLKWRVSFRWYAVAFLTGPLVLMAVHLGLSLISPIYLPGIFTSDNKASLLLLGIVAGIMVGIFEELGWTGFAVPRLRLRYSILSTGLIVGVIWGAWHILSNDVWAIRTYSGALSPTLFVILRGFGFLIGQLPPFRVLMVWVYDRTGSLLVAMLMHAGLTASSLILAPLAESGAPVLIYDLVLAVAMWVVAAAVAAANRGQLSRQPLLRRVD